MNVSKVITIAIALLIILISSGIYVSSILKRSSSSLENSITFIETKVASGDWVNAITNVNILQKQWYKTKKTWALLQDHSEIDNIDTTLIRVSQYIATKNTSLAIPEISILKQQLAHIPEKETFRLVNIL